MQVNDQKPIPPSGTHPGEPPSDPTAQNTQTSLPPNLPNKLAKHKSLTKETIEQRMKPLIEKQNKTNETSEKPEIQNNTTPEQPKIQEQQEKKIPVWSRIKDGAMKFGKGLARVGAVFGGIALGALALGLLPITLLGALTLHKASNMPAGNVSKNDYERTTPAEKQAHKIVSGIGTILAAPAVGALTAMYFAVTGDKFF